MARQRVLQQRHVLWNLHRNKFCSPLNLIDVLHSTLCVGEIVQNLVLHLMHTLHGHRDGGLGSNDLLLSVVPRIIDVVQNRGLSDDGSREGRVNLLCAHPSCDGQQHSDTNCS